MEFIVHEPIDAAQESVASEGGNHNAESSLAQEPEEEHVATASQEGPLVPRTTVLEDDAIIYIQELQPRLEATFNEARVTDENPIDASRAVDEALNSFFEVVDVGMLEDYSLWPLGDLKKDHTTRIR